MSTEYTNINKNLSERDITFSIWKRILNNLPYIYKTKGTKRAIRSLINCYGIPPTLLQIREYGGPDVEDNTHTTFIFDNYSFALNFYGDQYLRLPWRSSSLDRWPSALEIRYIGTSSDPYILNNSMSLLEVEDAFYIQLISTTGSYGYIKFAITTDGLTYISASTNSIPIFDNSPTYIIIQRSVASDSVIDQTVSIYGKKYIYGEINYDASASIIISSSYNQVWPDSHQMYIGGNNIYSKQLSGSIDELRLWDKPLSSSVIETHTKFPQSILGNTVTASFEDLVLRFSFDDPRNHSTSSYTGIENEAPLRSYYTGSMIFNGWPNETTFPYSYKLYNYESEAHDINLNNNRITNKVFIDTTTQLSGNLSPFTSVEKSAYDIPNLSSNLIGVYFSPTDMINEDIIRTLNESSIISLLGDPSDFYSSSYSDLTTLRKLYWNLTTPRITFNDYVQYIKNYDNSLFENIKQLLPARSNAILGISYEPNILERNKIKHKLPEVENATIEYRNIPYLSSSISSSYNVLDTQIYTTKSIMVSNDTNYKNFENYNIYNIIDISDNYSATGSYISVIKPIIDFTTGANTNYVAGVHWNNINTYSSSSGYNTRHYIRHACFGIWEKRLKHKGCIQTKDTTINKTQPIEIYSADSKKLFAKVIGNTKLQVE